MKETQKNYNDLQDKWVVMIYKVCLPLRMRCSIDDLCMKTKELWNDVSEALEPLVYGFEEFIEALSKVTEESKEIYIPRIKVKHPHYPQVNVDNFKINTRGFKLPPMRCARSRCK